MENLDWRSPPPCPLSVSLFSWVTFIRDLCCFRVYLLMFLSEISPVVVIMERTCDFRCAKSIRNRLWAIYVLLGYMHNEKMREKTGILICFADIMNLKFLL